MQPRTLWPVPSAAARRLARRTRNRRTHRPARLPAPRRGAAIDIVADRTRESRSQLVYTTARGRDVVFWQSRKLAEEYTYRYLAAAHTWLADNDDAAPVFQPAPAAPQPGSTEIRAWARSVGMDVSDRGRIPHRILTAWRDGGSPTP